MVNSYKCLDLKGYSWNSALSQKLYKTTILHAAKQLGALLKIVIVHGLGILLTTMWSVAIVITVCYFLHVITLFNVSNLKSIAI